MLGRASFVAIALVSAAIGAHSLNPRELYNEMYPVEAVKRDAFHICNEADPTFVRAVGVDREACYDSMPHLIAVALGRARPGGALTMAALSDPSREAELLMTLATMAPRQPVTVPRSFANTEWVRALSSSCDDKVATPAVAYGTPSGLPPPPGSGRAAALDSVILGNLPPMPRTAHAGFARQRALPIIPLAGGKQAAMPALSAGGGSDAVAAFAPLPTPDVGDNGPPAIVPLAPASACGA
jgi:hypothetical protein